MAAVPSTSDPFFFSGLVSDPGPPPIPPTSGSLPVPPGGPCPISSLPPRPLPPFTFGIKKSPLGTKVELDIMNGSRSPASSSIDISSNEPVHELDVRGYHPRLHGTGFRPKRTLTEEEKWEKEANAVPLPPHLDIPYPSYEEKCALEGYRGSSLSDEELSKLPAYNDPMTDRVCDLLASGKNAYLFGKGGSGKSCSLRSAAVKLAKRGLRVACVGMTGVSALGFQEYGMRGSTVHSWAGIGKGEGKTKDIIGRVYGGMGAKERIRLADVVLFEEISMGSGRFVGMLDDVFRTIRKKAAAYGGLKVGFSGDFLQLLSPERNEKGEKAPLAFTATEWYQLEMEPIHFTTGYRFKDDPRFEQLLENVRVGKIEQADMDLLATRLFTDDEIKEITDKECIVQLYPLHKQADEINERKMGELPGDEKVYVAKDFWYDGKTGRHLGGDAMPQCFRTALDQNIPAVIKLKKGAHVMLKRNQGDVGETHMANGTCGEILDMTDEAVLFKLNDGSENWVELQKWDHEVGCSKATRKQIPFILAWALSIHAAQGLTLDKVITRLDDKIFAEGQAYVAISRVRKLQDLVLRALSPKAFKCNEECRQFEETLIVIEQEKKKRRGEKGEGQEPDRKKVKTGQDCCS